MTAGTIGLLLFVVFFFLLAIGSPIMVALGLSTFAVYSMAHKDPVMLIQMAAQSLSSFPLMALPSFILAWGTDGGLGHVAAAGAHRGEHRGAAARRLGFTQHVNILWLLVVILLVFLGMFMETLALIMLVTPVLLPVMIAYGVDPIHFGVILVCCCGVGFSTPPMGENMFIASGIADESLEAISLKALPFVAINLCAIAILVAFPGLVLWLPNLLQGQ